MWPQSLCPHRCASEVHDSHSPCEVKNMAGQRKSDDGPFAFLLLAGGEALTAYLEPPLHLSTLFVITS